MGKAFNYPDEQRHEAASFEARPAEVASKAKKGQTSGQERFESVANVARPSRRRVGLAQLEEEVQLPERP